MRPDWDRTWLDVAHVIARRSRCSRAKVGSVIVDPTNRIVATGFNGPPANLPITADEELGCGSFCDRGLNGPTALSVVSYVDCVSIHSEANCLGFCDRRHREGGTIFITGHSCWTCSKLLANSGLARVVIEDLTGDRSYRDSTRGYDLLRASGLEVVLL